MSFEPIKITNKGRQLLAKALAGETLVFTKIKMGDGQITTQVIETMNDVIHEVISLKPNTPVIGDKYTSITGNFRNAAVEDRFKGDGATKAFKLSASPTTLTKVTIGGTETSNYTYASGTVTFSAAPAAEMEIKVTYNMDGFYWREVAVFALDPDVGEIMFAYQNAYALAENIKSASSGIIEKVIGASFVISSDVNIDVDVNESLVFMTLSQGQYKTEILEEAQTLDVEDLIPVYKTANQKNAKLAIEKLTGFLEDNLGIGIINETIAEKENKAEYEEIVMLASGWNQSAKTYSFETVYPNAQYDIEIGPSDDATVEQMQAYSAAMIPISTNSNIAIAKGDIPEIDIPLAVKVVRK